MSSRDSRGCGESTSARRLVVYADDWMDSELGHAAWLPGVVKASLLAFHGRRDLWRISNHSQIPHIEVQILDTGRWNERGAAAAEVSEAILGTSCTSCASQRQADVAIGGGLTTPDFDDVVLQAIQASAELDGGAGVHLAFDRLPGHLQEPGRFPHATGVSTTKARDVATALRVAAQLGHTRVGVWFCRNGTLDLEADLIQAASKNLVVQHVPVSYLDFSVAPDLMALPVTAHVLAMEGSECPMHPADFLGRVSETGFFAADLWVLPYDEIELAGAGLPGAVLVNGDPKAGQRVVQKMEDWWASLRLDDDSLFEAALMPYLTQGRLLPADPEQFARARFLWDALIAAQTAVTRAAGLRGSHLASTLEKMVFEGFTGTVSFSRLIDRMEERRVTQMQSSCTAV